MYSKKVMKHFRNPRNMGSMDDPDAVSKVGNPICGDVMKLYLKVGKNKDGKEFIKDIKFETFGCAAAIATSSMLTEMAKGKTLEQAKKITRDSVAEGLGGLPPIKMHCSNLSVKALKAAINDYQKS